MAAAESLKSWGMNVLSRARRIGLRPWISITALIVIVSSEFYLQSPFNMSTTIFSLKFTFTPGSVYLLVFLSFYMEQLRDMYYLDRLDDEDYYMRPETMSFLDRLFEPDLARNTRENLKREIESNREKMALEWQQREQEHEEKQKQIVAARGKDTQLLRKYACGNCDITLSAKNILCCSRCLSSIYCSIECQKKAWKEHKKVCKRTTLRGWVRGNNNSDITETTDSSSSFEKVLSAAGPLIAQFMSVPTTVIFDSAVSSRGARVVWMQKCLRHSHHYHHDSLSSAMWFAGRRGTVLSVVIRTQRNPLELVTDVDLKELGLLCPQLQSLSFNYPKSLLSSGAPAKVAHNCRDGATLVSDVGVRALAEYCPELRHLDLYGCKWVSNEGINAIAKGCPKLQSFELGWLGLKGEQNNPHHLITDAALATLAASCPELNSVCLNICCTVDIKAFDALKQKYKYISFER